MRARARVCAWARPHRRQRVRALPAAIERRGLGSQVFQSATTFNANIGAWNTASVTGLSFVCAASGPARTTADCAWSVVDACAVVVRGGAADVRVRAHVAMRIRVYVDGSPMDTHVCSSAIELPLHLGCSISNAHMHRPFPRCMYTYIRIYASIVCACVRACVCVGVRVRVRVRECVRVCVCLARHPSVRDA